MKNIMTRLNEDNINYQKCLMQIIKYNGANDIVVAFQDKYKTEVHTSYREFKTGNVKNPYSPSVYNVGIVGTKYPVKNGNKDSKEYKAWSRMLERSFSQRYKEKHPTYKNVTCSDEWLSYEKFYEWLHVQNNFNKWLHGDKWDLDKDIIIKGNKIYSPDTCCLIPNSVNKLFTKRENERGDYAIGVCKKNKKYQASCNDAIGEHRYLGVYITEKDAFNVYKNFKEDTIRTIAEDEYSKGNIIKKCYDAMINYKVEIGD